MGLAGTFILLALWLALAFRALQRGDTLLAGILLAAGVVLTIYRLRRLQRPADPGHPNDPTRR